jgi:hypothetical protein
MELRDLRRGKDVPVPRYPAVEEHEPQKPQFVDIPERSEDENLLYRRILVLWKCRLCHNTESFGVSGSEEDATMCNHCYEKKGRSRAIADTKGYALPRKPGTLDVFSTLEEWTQKQNQKRKEPGLKPLLRTSWRRSRHSDRRQLTPIRGITSTPIDPIDIRKKDRSKDLSRDDWFRDLPADSDEVLPEMDLTPSQGIVIFHPSSAF